MENETTRTPGRALGNENEAAQKSGSEQSQPGQPEQATVTASPKPTTAAHKKAAALVALLKPMTAQIVASGEEHAAMLFVQVQSPKGGEPQIIQTLLPPNVNKDQIASAHRRAAELPHVTMAVLLMECWHYHGKGDKAQRIYEEISAGRMTVSDLPERGEGIMYNVRQPGGKQSVFMFNIDKAATPWRLSEDTILETANDEQDGAQIEGRFIGDGHGEARMRIN